MRQAAWLLMLAPMTACSPPYTNPHTGSPVAEGEIRLSMAQVNPGHARSDAAKALARGDRRLLGVYGYAAEVPGVDAHAAGRPVVFIEDTSDQIRDFGHARFNRKAAAYALVYNQALLDQKN